MRFDDTQVRRATVGDTALAAPLFALYRKFYGQTYDEALAATFLRARLEQGQSVVLLAERAAGPPIGFAQLYPGFSSVAAAPVWLLGDLYVRESARRSGVAEALMEHAEVLARRAGAVYLTLETAKDNGVAQRLYERAGYTVVDTFLQYEKPLT